MNAKPIAFREFVTYTVQLFMQQPDFVNYDRRFFGGGFMVYDFMM